MLGKALGEIGFPSPSLGAVLCIRDSGMNSLDIKQFSIIPLLIPTKSPRLRSGPQTETANRAFAVPNGNETANRDRRVLLNI